MVKSKKIKKRSILMELPREIQIYIYSYLFDKWRIKWSKVMKEVLSIEIKERILRISNLMYKSWKIGKEMSLKICLDCGEYYSIPMYSCHAIGCAC